jgi:hypothetical protein
MGGAKLDAPGKKISKALIMNWIFPEDQGRNSENSSSF